MRTLQADVRAEEGRLDELVALYAKSGQWEELYDVLQQTAERLTATDGARRIEVLARAAEIAHVQLRSQDKAARAYERILALDPDQGEATRTAAAARIRFIARRRSGRASRLTYEVLLGFEKAADEQLAMLREIRELCEESWLARARVLLGGACLRAPPR